MTKKITISWTVLTILSLIVALIFLSFFALTFGNESKIRKEALDKIQEVAFVV